MSVQWYPGHMAKAKKLLIENCKLVDVVMELRDARIPESSYNPLLQAVIGNKPRLVLLTKSDLADPQATKAWMAQLARVGVDQSLALNVLGPNLGKTILPLLEQLAAPKLPRNKQNGAPLRPVRTMVVGIPNVGKSSFDQLLGQACSHEDWAMPGVTRTKQWIKLAESVELLDTPGMLWPKLEDPLVARKLGVTGAVGQGGFDALELATWLLAWLAAHHPSLLRRYELTNLDLTGAELLAAVGQRRGCLMAGGAIDLVRTADIVLLEFRTGKLGKVTLDELPTKQPRSEQVEDVSDETRTDDRC